MNSCLTTVVDYEVIGLFYRVRHRVWVPLSIYSPLYFLPLPQPPGKFISVLKLAPVCITYCWTPPNSVFPLRILIMKICGEIPLYFLQFIPLKQCDEVMLGFFWFRCEFKRGLFIFWMVTVLLDPWFLNTVHKSTRQNCSEYVANQLSFININAWINYEIFELLSKSSTYLPNWRSAFLSQTDLHENFFKSN